MLGRLRGGATDEALLHLGGYIGVPTVREAMLIADRVFREVEAEAKQA